MLRCNDQTNLEMKFVTGALRRVLVIEDDAETAKQIVDFLTTRGYQVDFAVDGNEGVRPRRIH